MTNEGFSTILRREFDRSDQTMTEAAAAVGVHYNTFRKYVTGATRPRKAHLVRLRAVFPALRDVDTEAVAS